MRILRNAPVMGGFPDGGFASAPSYFPHLPPETSNVASERQNLGRGRITNPYLAAEASERGRGTQQ